MYMQADTSSKKRLRITGLANHDIALLQAWYDHLGETSSAHSNARLVVFLPNVEMCDADILRDVMHICRWAYLHRLLSEQMRLQ